MTYDDQTARTRSVFNALARLERAGNEHSKATEKLIAAAKVLSNHIVEQPAIPVDVELPRRYQIAWRYAGDVLSLFVGDEAVYASRSTALQFAADVASGWLDELAQWLEEGTAKAAAGTALLNGSREAAAELLK